jgi:hypothetical protein
MRDWMRAVGWFGLIATTTSITALPAPRFRTWWILVVTYTWWIRLVSGYHFLFGADCGGWLDEMRGRGSGDSLIPIKLGMVVFDAGWRCSSDIGSCWDTSPCDAFYLFYIIGKANITVSVRLQRLQWGAENREAGLRPDWDGRSASETEADGDAVQYD